MHRRDHRPARDRDPQSRQARRDARIAGAARRRGGLGGRTRPRRARGNRRRRFAPMPRSRRSPRRRRADCRPSPTIPASWSMRWTARPESTRRAGPAEARISRRAMTRIERLLQERGATTPDSASAHFVSALCVAWPDGHLEEVEARVDGTLVWPPRGTAGFGYDPAFLPDGHDAHLRRDDQRSRSTACRRWASACRTARAPSSNWRRSALTARTP